MAAAVSGCSGTGDATLGTVTVNLTGQATSGAVYRLRDAIITVQGATPKVWNTEDDPSRTSLSDDVAIGEYSALLQDGWRMERVLSATAVTISASLLSDNPVSFTVTPHHRTSVPLRFLVDGGTVDMSQGYDLTLDVTESSCSTATEATDCGPHQFCNVRAARCACVAGYTDSGQGCAWTGTIRDPGIIEPSTWTVANGALLNPTSPGGIEPGEASFIPSTLCTLAHIKQTFDMPAFARAERLVLELSYKNTLSFRDFFGSVLMGVSWGRSWEPLPFFFDGGFHTTRICLGESAYAPAGTAGRGSPVTLSLGPYAPASDCPSTSVTNFAIDHARIVTANPGECGARFGEGINFDAEGTGGWTFSVPADANNGFIPGLGVGGSRAARMQAPCSAQVAMTHDLDIVARNPALELFVGTTGGAATTIAQASVANGLFPIPLPPVGQTASLHMCLPSSLAGLSTSIVFSALTNPITGTCAGIPEATVFADDVHVVEDPACQSSDAAGNPGFEEPGAMFGAFAGSVIGRDLVGSGVVIRNTPGIAHSGTGYLAIESYSWCSTANVVLAPIVPAPTTTAGPALTFWSRVDDAPDIFTNVGALTLAKGGGWIENTLCLNPLFAGRPQPVGIFQYGGNPPGGQNCDAAGYGTQAALLDDLEVTTDPSCPIR